MPCHRFALYYTPPPGPLADFGAAWLGWDLRRGVAVARSAPDCAAVTATPGRYGFHATLKAPFALAEGESRRTALARLHDLAAGLAPVILPEGLALRHDFGFLALVSPRPVPALAGLESALMRGMDGLRAPLTARDRARRRPEALTPRQRAHLDRWGYPWVLGDFRFHMTLTGPVADPAPVIARLAPLLPADLGAALTIAQVSLVGEDTEGRFHLIADVPLGG